MNASGVAVLGVKPGSAYFDMVPRVSCFDQVRDLRSFSGTCPVVAHPPCRLFSRRRAQSTAPASEKLLAYRCVRWVQRNGGVLEHPSESALWRECGLPRPGDGTDRVGGWTLCVDQWWWGHPARKRTWLYIVGVEARYLPSIPYRMGEPLFVVGSTRSKRRKLKDCGKSWRDATPPSFAEWLVQVAESVF